MKIFSRILLLLVSTVLVPFVSCVGEASDTESAADSVPSLDLQIASMKATLEDIHAVQAEIPYEGALEYCSGLIRDHISSVEAGGVLAEASSAALNLQKDLACVSGALRGRFGLDALLDDMDDGVASWLGPDLSFFYPLAVRTSRLGFVISGIRSASADLEALESEAEDSCMPLSSALGSCLDSASGLDAEFSTLSEEVFQAYLKVLRSEGVADLKSLNVRVYDMLKTADVSISDLASRLAQCEADIEALKERLSSVEEEIEGVLGMIQSIAFVSEYSSEYAAAYYTLSDELDPVRSDAGMKARIPEPEFSLGFLIRPASAAAAFTDRSMWNNSLVIKGYEAPFLQFKSVADDLKNLEVTDVDADPATGFVSISVKSAFSDSFYFREVGAKVCLAVISGRTDMTSVFVDVLPVDRSGKVYVESLSLSHSSAELQKGESIQLSALISPSDVSDSGVEWISSDPEVVSVDENGVVTAIKASEDVVHVTAHTKGTDAFGRILTATCDIAVRSGVILSGESFVEIGSTEKIVLESSEYIAPDRIRWESEDSQYAEVETDHEGNALVTGRKLYYNFEDKSYQPVDIRCIIDDVTILVHKMNVVAVQPRSVRVDGISDDADKFRIKVGSELDVKASVFPSMVDTQLFRIVYQTADPGVVTVDFSSGRLVGKALGNAAIDISVMPDDKYNYFYPKKDRLVRKIYFHVDPYYVKTISLPATVTLNPDDVTRITPEFTSDVDGHMPTRVSDVVWSVVEQSESGVVSVDPVTGEIRAGKVGTARIRVTTTGAWTVPDHEDPKYAECVIVIEDKDDTAPKVGDYYYSDGTWSSLPDASKTVVGVVFSTVNATLSDSVLASDHPSCTHGLVVGTKEYLASFGNFKYDDIGEKARHIYTYLISRGEDAGKTDRADGYAHSKLLGHYRKDYSDYDYCQMYDAGTGVAAKHGAIFNVQTGKTSGWYIPSYYEMKLLFGSMGTVNSSLSAIGGETLHDSYYWMSTLWVRYDYYCDTYAYPFSMHTGDWGAVSGTCHRSKEYPTRVILAF